MMPLPLQVLLWFASLCGVYYLGKDILKRTGHLP